MSRDETRKISCSEKSTLYFPIWLSSLSLMVQVMAELLRMTFGLTIGSVPEGQGTKFPARSWQVGSSGSGSGLLGGSKQLTRNIYFLIFTGVVRINYFDFV